MMNGIEAELDEDRFESFDLSMSIVSLMNYIKNESPLRGYFKDIEVLSTKVRDQCRNEKYRVDAIKQRLRETENENKFLKIRLEKISKENNRLRNERDTFKEELRMMGCNRKQHTPNRQLEKAEEMLHQLKQEFDDQIKTNAKRRKDFERESNDIIFSLEKKIKNLEKDATRRELTIIQLTEKLRRTRSTDMKLDNAIHDHGDDISKLKEVLQQILQKLHETESELDETKTRLSKAMGVRLTDNNPNIADLSDRNRPTKLAERFIELYDNQWTDAFDLIDKYLHSETKTIGTLLHILKDTMTFCKAKEEEQMQELIGVLQMSYKQGYHCKPHDVPKDLKDCRKTFSSFAINNLYQTYISHVEDSRDPVLKTALEISWFTKECIELCWLFVIQDPPIVFAGDGGRGSQFDNYLFKPYTSSGTYIDYIVWPALLLHENGPVLAKGVAQGFGRKSKGIQPKMIRSKPDAKALRRRKDNKSTIETKHDPRRGQSHLETSNRQDSVREQAYIPIGFDLVNTDIG